MSIDNTTLWTIIVLLGLGTFGLRFSFLGLIGKRPLPEWALRLLRYTPVAVLPGLIAPALLVVPEGASLPPLVPLASVLVTLVLGVWTKNPIWSMLGGAATLVALTLLGLS